MHIIRRPKAVVLGLTSKMPFAGIVLLTFQYLVGLRQLGFDVFYVEEHGKMPWLLMERDEPDGGAVAARFIATLMRRFGLEDDHWAFRAPHDHRQSHGMSDAALNAVFRDAAIILNLHGGTIPRPEHAAGGRLVYVGTDPVEVEVSLDNGDQAIVDYLEPHCAFFTWGENYGRADCGVPVSTRFEFVPTRQPIVMDLWKLCRGGPATTFTTVGNWRQPYRNVAFRGETYHWSKHLEFLKFVDLPRRCDQPFELALINANADDQALLRASGWQVRDASSISLEIEPYQQYIGGSRGEFTVAKDQNVRLRSGWFSDRSASYLACGKPVVTQDTGFSNILPTGAGLFAFSTVADVEDAIQRINADYAKHSRAAWQIARDCFDHRAVLGAMLDHLACRPAAAGAGA